MSARGVLVWLAAAGIAGAQSSSGPSVSERARALHARPPLPRGMRDVRDLPMITEAMPRRGYSEERIRKFLGGNLLRVFRQVTEKVTIPLLRN